MSMGGDPGSPCGFATFFSIGGIDVEMNCAHSAAIFPILKEHLGIEATKCYIDFQDAKRANVGYNGATFQKD